MREQPCVKALLVCSILNFTPFSVSLGDGGLTLAFLNSVSSKETFLTTNVKIII